ncbi:MAG: HD domain-containing protein [Acidimicrobiales bacterium]
MDDLASLPEPAEPAGPAALGPARISAIAAEVGGGELAGRIGFLLEVDRLKSVVRRNLLVDGSRYENSAEHSWHLALLALVLAPYADAEVDVARAAAILLVHDLVEIDAGDTYIYDDEARTVKQEAEERAAERLFGLLPEGEGRLLAELWHEYEARETPTARFAYAMDRLQPVLLNAGSGGVSWVQNGIRHSQTVAVNGPIADAAPPLWDLARAVLDAAATADLLIDDRP